MQKNKFILVLLFIGFGLSNAFAQYNYATGETEDQTKAKKQKKETNTDFKKLRVYYDLYNTVSFFAPKKSDEPAPSSHSDFDIKPHLSNSHHAEIEYYFIPQLSVSAIYKHYSCAMEDDLKIELPDENIYDNNYGTGMYDTYIFGKIKGNGVGLGVKFASDFESTWQVGLQLSGNYLSYKTEIDTLLVYDNQDINFAGDAVYVDDKYSALLTELKFTVEKDIANIVVIRFGVEAGYVLDRLSYLSGPIGDDSGLTIANYVHGVSVMRTANMYYANIFLGVGIKIF